MMPPHALHGPDDVPRAASLQPLLQRLLTQISTVLVGKPEPVCDAVACLLAGGHLLIEDLPGVGKTTLAHALAHALGLRFARVQFTADLMPSDLIGVSIYERERSGSHAGAGFVFHRGPLFTQVLLADEINRAGPRTQSALLEAMEEQQVSVDGKSHALPTPFFVIATQNPAEQLGTHPLPESQLDRFLMRIRLGYPDANAERTLLTGGDRRTTIRTLDAVMSPADLLAVQAAVQRVHAAPALIDTLQALLSASRSGEWFVHGLSPRAGLAWLRAARARALLDGRDHVIPDDLQAVALPVLAHRLMPRGGARPGTAGRGSADAAVQGMLASVGLV